MTARTRVVVRRAVEWNSLEMHHDRMESSSPLQGISRSELFRVVAHEPAVESQWLLAGCAKLAAFWAVDVAWLLLRVECCRHRRPVQRQKTINNLWDAQQLQSEKMFFEVKRAQSSMKSKFVGEEKSLIYLSRQKPGEGKEGIPLFYTNVRKLRFFVSIGVHKRKTREILDFDEKSSSTLTGQFLVLFVAFGISLIYNQATRMSSRVISVFQLDAKRDR